MTEEMLNFARELVALGIPIPGHTTGKTVIGSDEIPATKMGTIGQTFRSTKSGLLFIVLLVNESPELLPVPDDYAILGWMMREARIVHNDPYMRARFSPSRQRWEVYSSSGKALEYIALIDGKGSEEIEAWAAALRQGREGGDRASKTMVL